MQNKTIPNPNLANFPLYADNSEKILLLETRIKKLGDICDELNPYLPIPDDFKLRLREFNILEVSDPFKITNALLILLEDSINELHTFKPLSEEEMKIENLK